MTGTPLKDCNIKILLASGSPRRRELLAMIAPDFTVAPSRDVDESYPSDMPAEEVAVYLSGVKAEAYKDLLADDEIIITADTVVIIDDRILGKPADRDDAIAMLKSLSGRRHKVVTGVTVTTKDRSISFDETTAVEFALLSDDEINHYIDTFKPYDKAGAYGIQEWIGAVGIKGIEGCYYNVMGLPVHTLYHRLKKFRAYDTLPKCQNKPRTQHTSPPP